MVVYGFSNLKRPTKTAVELSREVFGNDIVNTSAGSSSVDKFSDVREVLHKEVLSMNVQYLDSIHALINQYILSAFKGDMDISLNALALLCELISPKIDVADEELILEQLEGRINKAIIRDSDGHVTRINPTEITAIKYTTRRLFKAILKKIDMVGMLTIMPKDYKSVMGDFSNS